MRVLLDTNVLLAGIATHGLCEALLTVCFRDHEVVLCDHILAEVREHYQTKFKATPDRAAAVVEVLRRQSQTVQPDDVPKAAFEDSDDLPVLGTLTAGKADCLVTGDHALLELGDYHGVPILSPRAFYDRIRG